MKRIIVIIALALLSVAPVLTFSVISSLRVAEEQPKAKDIAIKEATTPEQFEPKVINKMSPLPGSTPSQIVKASYFYAFEYVELAFTRDIGVVTIMLTDLTTGEICVDMSCDSGLESYVHVPLVQAPGLYELTIIGIGYSGIGTFEL